ncbi:MAG: histidine--tRNA ligase [Coriobacteriales bacterium]|jgi:histidyl-tRNA synthetase|nr:histidine--tRNA ligase [Coriobacteriales bacterium]
MALQAPKGTADLLPADAQLLNIIIQAARRVFTTFGYQYLETPAFEYTEVFVRGIGEATDVVGKEMFHVCSRHAITKLSDGEQLKSDERMALRPEGTAGVARAIVQHNLVSPGAPPAKLWYAGQMFRHERPQKGRLRQFHQIGLECVGAKEPVADAEVIIALMRFFAACGIPQDAMRLFVNSMGDENCRPIYRNVVRDYINANASGLCDECRRRADTNPLRAFDCKNPSCVSVMQEAPKISAYLCDDCNEHYSKVKGYLANADIDYVQEPRLVRGLDYYTRTVFEVQVDTGLGSQNAIGGGGRYDRLIEEFGGKPTSGLGFAVGVERIALVLEALGVKTAGLPSPDVFVAAAPAPADYNSEVLKSVFACTLALRDAGIIAEQDLQSRSLKSQFKLADKLGARFCVVIGYDEVAAGKVRLRDLFTHEEQELLMTGLLDVITNKLAS